MDWQKGVPEKHGYYLVAWRSSLTEVIVSELWYNPDAIYPWWFTRGYSGEPTRGGVSGVLHREVIAWMPMPDPPVET
jgi:hypothetical protein